MEKGQIYRCNVCGNIVELIHVGGGNLVCCGNEMELLSEEPKDVGAEKHVPVLEKTEKGFKVKVGSVPHPMEETHFIEWIELQAGDEVCKKFLKPGDTPEAEFELEDVDLSDVKAREYCTIHGLWRS